MDLLADVLRQTGLRKRVLNQRSFEKSMALEFPCGKSLGFHVVIVGTAYIHTNGKQTIKLEKGDVALMARGVRHVVSTEPDLPKKIQSMAENRRTRPRDSASAEAKLTIVSGAYQIWNDPVHPVFSELPEWFVLKSTDLEGSKILEFAIRSLGQEVARPELGTETVIQALLDLIFTEIIRKIFKSQRKQESWGHGLQDAQIRKAVEHLHRDLSREWRLDELADQVGLSRAGFAAKFKKSLGMTPFQYLATLRIQRAMELLTGTDDKIETIAQAVGYADAFSFSKVFKKLAGLPPRDFRARDQLERSNSWRFQ